MSSNWIKPAVRSMFAVTSRNRAGQQARRYLRQYLRLADGLNGDAGSRPVRVPPMPGVDKDMRNWSFFMVLAHNRIVSESISATVRHLARGEPLSGAALIDPKEGVMPSASAGQGEVQRFRDAVDDHLKMVEALGPLRGTRTTPHALFGDFDAHRWNCMFAFHMKVHLRQAEMVAREAKLGSGIP